MKASLYTRVLRNGKRPYKPVNKKKVYPGTLFVLRYARRWETLTADNLTAALAARAIKEATLLNEQPSTVAKTPTKHIAIDDAISVYISNTAATKSTGPSARAVANNSWTNSPSRV
jgi:hypothetical protein